MEHSRDLKRGAGDVAGGTDACRWPRGLLEAAGVLSVSKALIRFLQVPREFHFPSCLPRDFLKKT